METALIWKNSMQPYDEIFLNGKFIRFGIQIEEKYQI